VQVLHSPGVGKTTLALNIAALLSAGNARNVLLVSRVNNNPCIRVMIGLKNTFAPEGSPIAFELNEINGFRWIGNVKSARKTDDLYWKSVQ
jgi:hypothetical protein